MGRIQYRRNLTRPESAVVRCAPTPIVPVAVPVPQGVIASRLPVEEAWCERCDDRAHGPSHRKSRPKIGHRRSMVAGRCRRRGARLLGGPRSFAPWSPSPGDHPESPPWCGCGPSRPSAWGRNRRHAAHQSEAGVGPRGERVAPTGAGPGRSWAMSLAWRQRIDHHHSILKSSKRKCSRYS